MISGLLCSNSLSVCIGKFHKIFLCLMYHFSAFSNHHFSHSFPWITFATLSCLKFSYTMCYLGSFGDKVCHCLTSVPHNRHKEDTSPYTTFLMSFVHNAWSWAAVDCALCYLFRIDFLRPISRFTISYFIGPFPVLPLWCLSFICGFLFLSYFFFAFSMSGKCIIYIHCH